MTGGLRRYFRLLTADPAATMCRDTRLIRAVEGVLPLRRCRVSEIQLYPHTEIGYAGIAYAGARIWLSSGGGYLSSFSVAQGLKTHPLDVEPWRLAADGDDLYFAHFSETQSGAGRVRTIARRLASTPFQPLGPVTWSPVGTPTAPDWRAVAVVRASDGVVWIAERYPRMENEATGSHIRRLTAPPANGPEHAETVLPPRGWIIVDLQPGPAGGLFLVAKTVTGNALASMTPGGTITKLASLPSGDLKQSLPASDGTLWLVGRSGSKGWTAAFRSNGTYLSWVNDALPHTGIGEGKDGRMFITRGLYDTDGSKGDVVMFKISPGGGIVGTYPLPPDHFILGPLAVDPNGRAWFRYKNSKTGIGRFTPPDCTPLVDCP